MAKRSRTLTAFFLVVGFAFGLLVGYLIVTRKHRPRFHAICEYWVYLPGTEMPGQSALLDRMIGSNPFAQAGRSPIGKTEGLVFSDVRLHTALILRSKNTNVFRPDLFESDVDLTASQLQALSRSQSIVKIRFLSDQVLPDKRHLQFCIHAAAAAADLGSGELVYDVTSERMMDLVDLQSELAEHFDATTADLHVRTVWSKSDVGGHAYTKGLPKIGSLELKTAEIAEDEKTLAMEVITAATHKIWREGKAAEPFELDVFHDKFQLLLGVAKDGFVPVRIMRVQPQ